MVIGIMGLMAFVGVFSLCLTLFFRNYADPAVLTAIISITSGSLGSLGTMLVSTKSQMPGGNTTATITTTTAAPPPEEPTPVVVTNTVQDPVPTTEAH